MLRKNKAVIVVAMVCLLCTAIFVIYTTVNASPRLTEEEAIAIVKEQYDGEIIVTKQQDKDYIVTLAMLAGTYEITVPKSGIGITNIAKLEQQLGSDIDLPTGQEEVGNKGEQDTPEASAMPTNQPIATAPTEDIEGSPIEKTTTKPTADVVPTATPEVTASILTDKKAAELALKQVAGEVDDIELKSNGDQRYYLIEIEAANGKDAVVQLNAITGKVMSVSWENDDQSDDETDDD